jgi:EVE domain-containing protein
MSGNWIAVACAEHVRRGRELGFMQVCHGKGAPLRRIQPGDRVAYYSPTVAFPGKDKLRAFTAIGVVKAAAPYQFDMGGGFRPFRRDVTWLEADETPIQPLVAELEFSAGKRNWGYQLRYGLLSVSDHDMEKIAKAMGAALSIPGRLE